MVSLMDMETEELEESDKGLGNQQGFTGFDLGVTTSDVPVDLPAEDLAPAMGQKTRTESLAYHNPLTTLDDIDVDELFAEWQGQLSTDQSSLYTERPFTTDCDIFNTINLDIGNVCEH